MSDVVRMANDSELKKVVKFAGDGLALVGDMAKGFSLGQLVSGYNVVQEAVDILKSPQVLIPEWEQLDDAARADLVAYVQANVKVPGNVVVEAYAQKVLQSAVAVSAVVKLWIL